MSYLFGPVNSSRLGRSLGVDLIPYKICNYDCLYCECGKTTAKVNRRGHFVQLERLVQEFGDYLSTYGEDSFDVVTLTGSGETTLEIRLGEVIWQIRQRTSKPIAVLTNGSLMGDTQVQKDLALADIVLPSLDAASPQIFQKVDQPDPNVKIEDVIVGMIKFRRKYPEIQFWLEVLLVQGVNDGDEEIQRLKRVIDLIEPHKVDVVTVSRPPAYPNVAAVSQERLLEVQNILWPENHGKSGTLGFSRQEKADSGSAIRNRDLAMVLETLKRRPCSSKDLALMFGINKARLELELKAWVRQGLLRAIEHEGNIFFSYYPSNSFSNNELY